jgi:3',5'-cyclic AMP phosphodiesterase CpdA
MTEIMTTTLTMPQTFTLAHLSDVHLGPIAGFHPRYWNAKRALGYLNWHRNRRTAYRRDILDRLIADLQAQLPDHIAISGDLINIGLPTEMAAAARWLADVGPPEQVSVIPGNHDIYTGIGRDPGIARWSAYMAGRPQSAFPYVRRLGPIGLIGLNSAHTTKPFVASGRIGKDQLAQLAGCLDQLKADGLIRVVMIHHPPLPGLTRASHALSDAAAVRDCLSRHGAELVLHGHLHRNIAATILSDGGPIPVIGVPSAAMGRVHPHEPLARYNLLHITPTATGAHISLTGRGLTAVDGCIVEIERRVISGAV